MKRTDVNKYRVLQQNKRTARRYYMWFAEGKRDGMCGICRELSAIPKLFREAYNNGHTYGMIERAAA